LLSWWNRGAKKQKKHNKKNQRGFQKRGFSHKDTMSRQSILQVFFALVVICIFLFLLIDNLNMRKRVCNDFECYRTLIHECIEESIRATSLPIPLRLSANASARASIKSVASLVGGFRELSRISGFDCVMIYNTMTLHNRQMRKEAIAKGLLPDHPLNRVSSEEEPLPASAFQDDEQDDSV